MLRPSILSLGVLAIGVAPPIAAQRGEQRSAFTARQQGRLLPEREIVRRVTSVIKDADYLGFDFDAASSVYTLKFLRDGTVIWVEVDGRSGQILGRTDR